jgi:hypothetical protein
MPPCDKFDASARGREVGAEAAEECDALDEPDTDRTGEMVAMADPGRAGRFRVARAFFCASIASLKDGFELAPIVLFERPIPGRATGSIFLGELGLLGSFWSSFCAVESRASIMLQGPVSIPSHDKRQREGFLRFSLGRPYSSEVPVRRSHALPNAWVCVGQTLLDTLLQEVKTSRVLNVVLVMRLLL